MKLKNILTGAALTGALLLPGIASAQTKFDENFNDSTLRVDYMFGGGPAEVTVLLHSQSKSAGWAGRRANLEKAFYPGNGSIRVVDPETDKVLYENTFSSLFQEWLNTPEALTTPRSFENTLLVPLPKKEAEIVVTLYDNRHEVIASTTHTYLPGDELVAKRPSSPYEKFYIHRGGDPKETIDVAMLAEGYTADEKQEFLKNARTLCDEILRYEPFASNKEKFNFVAVMVPSVDSGVSVPLEGKWINTPFGSHYSTFHSARYLTAPRVMAMHDALTGIPYEHVIVLTNTDRYGGGGIYNNYTIAAARNELSLPVTVHEFGHGFGGLADEYFYIGEEDSTFPLDIEPWEPNITTLVNFESKWKDMVKPGTKIPTPAPADNRSRAEKMKKQNVSKKAQEEKEQTVGVYEGGGYRAKGVYRPVETCRMRDNFHPTFCPVCERAISRLIEYYTPKE